MATITKSYKLNGLKPHKFIILYLCPQISLSKDQGVSRVLSVLEVLRIEFLSLHFFIISGCLLSQAKAHLHLSSKPSCVILILPSHLFLVFSSTLKDPFNYIGPTGIIQNEKPLDFKVSYLTTLILSATLIFLSIEHNIQVPGLGYRHLWASLFCQLQYNYIPNYIHAKSRKHSESFKKPCPQPKSLLPTPTKEQRKAFPRN